MNRAGQLEDDRRTTVGEERGAVTIAPGETDFARDTTARQDGLGTRPTGEQRSHPALEGRMGLEFPIARHDVARFHFSYRRDGILSKLPNPATLSQPEAGNP